MFRWLLKPKFYSKCKSYMKDLDTRLEIIQKRRNAVQKFIKSDIAELLRSGYDYNSYRKAEELLLEKNMSSCYQLVAKFIGCISDHLDDLSKQGDCPDECKEAIPSLIYAAARFADLPELRHLRTLFTEKFGNSLELYLSKEFVEKLRRDPPAREMKIRLLHDIAQEFSIEWDGTALEQGLYTQPSLQEERPKLDKSDKYRHVNGDKWRQQRSRISSDDETSTDMSSLDGRKGSSSSSSVGSTSEDEVDIQRPSSYWLVPPPYLKQNANKGESNSWKTNDSVDHNLHDHEKPIPRSVRRRAARDNVSDPKTHDSVSGKGKAYPSQQPDNTGQNRRGTGTRSYVRGTSLPTEPTNAVETSKVPARAISFDPERGGAGPGRVHPNLPDYDDLVARLAALRSR